MPRAAERTRLSPAGRRAATLLRAGAIGGHLAAVSAVGVTIVVAGAPAGVWAAIGAAAALAFYTIGLATQVLVADSSPRTVLFAALASYALRVTVLGLALAAALASPAFLAMVHPGGLFTGVAAVVVGWLGFEIATYRRLRIPVYDDPPAPGGAGAVK